MYILVYESKNTNNKYLLHYDINDSNFYLKNEKNERVEIPELSLYNELDNLFKLHKKD